MAVSKVIYDGEPLIDLTGDTVTEDTLLEGMTAHGANGAALTGKMKNYAVDNEPTMDSENLVKSGGVYSAIPRVVSSDDIDIDTYTSADGKAEYVPVINKTALLNYIYPVGAIYRSVNSASPASFLGGTWTQIKDTFLLAAGSTYAAGATGGEAEHTLTEAELAEHRHSVLARRDSGGSDYSSTGADCSYWYYDTTSIGYISCHSAYAGGGAAHNNMPPYLTVYTWKRTA